MMETETNLHKALTNLLNQRTNKDSKGDDKPFLDLLPRQPATPLTPAEKEIIQQTLLQYRINPKNPELKEAVQKAVEIIIRSHIHLIKKVVLKYFKDNPELLEDELQEAIIKVAFLISQKFNPEHEGTITGFIQISLENHARTRSGIHNKDKSSLRDYDPETIWDQHNSETDILNNIFIQELLKSLDQKQQEIIKLFFGLTEEGPLTIKEIAARLQMGESTVRRLKRQALELIKARIPKTNNANTEKPSQTNS